MKIKLYGTGALVTKRFSACAMVDDAILFDCPNGLVRKLRQDDINLTNIQTLLISHFHADHDYDVYQLLWDYNRTKRQEKLNIIAPKGFHERYSILCNMAWPGMFIYDDMLKNVNLNILEAEDKKSFELDGYKITAYKVEHANCDSYGYKIQKNDKTVAFTGDAGMSDNIHALVENCDMAFIDVTGTASQGQAQIHFSVPMFMDLQSAHPSVRLIPTHMGDAASAELEANSINPPEDGDTLEI